MRRYWVIAPAHCEQQDDWQQIWDFDLRHSLISIGWRDIGDVSKLDIDAIKKRFRNDDQLSDAGFKQSRGASAKMLWKFYNEVKPGHVVISRRGPKQLAAIGIVQGRPYHAPTAPDGWPDSVFYWLPNHLPVKWQKPPRAIEFDEPVFGIQTIHEIKEQKLRDLLGRDFIKLPASICLADDEADLGKYKPRGTDERKLVERQIKERRGQQAFRDTLLRRYGSQCLVTGCEVVAVLEAAHINPYRGEKDNHVTNGLILRADIHTLFDLDLLGIDPATLTVRLSPTLKSEYAELEGQKLHCSDGATPSKASLKLRFGQFNEKRRLEEES